jgi:predicted enzyme related to lactoylglutathione lyase
MADGCIAHKPAKNREALMAQVLGIGGVFYKAKDPAALADWYQRVLGVGMEDWGHSRGTMFPGALLGTKAGSGGVLSAFGPENKYFEPSRAAFMINLCVDDLAGMLARAAAAGVEPTGPVVDEPSGRFAHLIDPEGVKIELWEPVGPAA